MDNTLEIMLGTTLLFGGENLVGHSPHSPNPQITEIIQATTRWYEVYKSPRKEQQVFELLRTAAGQDFVRKELNLNFEFGPPMLEAEIKLEYKWALTLLLAKYGIVPRWQSGMFIFANVTEARYARIQKRLLSAAGCDVTPLELVENWSASCAMCTTDHREAERFQKNKQAAQLRRECLTLSKWVRETSDRVDSVTDWFSTHTDRAREESTYKYISQLPDCSHVYNKFQDRFAKNNIIPIDSNTWRRDVKKFFWKWLTIFELAGSGIVCSWQFDWTPEYKSDYLCFIEQIRILKQFGHDPWPLLQQLPAEPPTKYRTLEDVLFEK